MGLIIDGFAHVMPNAFAERLAEIHPTDELQELAKHDYFSNMENRVRVLDKHGLDKQVLTLARPSIWIDMPSEAIPKMTRLANDGVARIANEFPARDLYPGTSLASLPRDPLDYFKRFYGDSMLCGSVHAFECDYKFFGPEHIIMATDYPFGPQQGELWVKETLNQIKGTNLPQTEKNLILGENLLKLMRRQ